MLFLGTAAAECYPNPFCECPACREARRSSDRRLKRRRSSFLFSETTMIDFNADSMYACGEFGVSLSRLNYVLLTHIHEDHFDYFNAAFPSMAVTPPRPITFFASPAACKGMKGILEAAVKLPHRQLVRQLAEMASISSFTALPAYEATQLGDMRITPVVANHAGFFEDELGYNYIIEKDGRTTFYATDTGRFFNRTMQFLAGRPVHTLIIEGSFGKFQLPPDSGHLNAYSLCETLDQLFAQDTLGPESRVFVTHIGHKGAFNLTDYQSFLDARYAGQVQVAWDGLRI